MKKLILCLIFLFSVLLLQAQWTAKATFPAGSRIAGLSFAFNDKVYVLGGMKKSGSSYLAYKDLWCFDPQNNSWDSVSSYPGGNIYGGVCFVIDSLVYIGLGGNKNGTLSNKFYSFNPVSKTWVQKANFPSTLRIYPFFHSIDKKGYIGCGVSTQTLLSDHWQYDPATNSWTEKDAYPGGGSVGLASFSLNGKGYAGLGDDGLNFYNDFYQYDPQLDDWFSKAEYNGQNKSFPSCISAGNYGFILGGEQSHLTYTNDLWHYDANANQWVKSSVSFSGTARRYGVFQLVKNRFYYGLGQIGESDEDAAADFWEGSSPLSLIETAEKGFAVYPNPVLNAQIHFKGNISGRLTVFNSLGVQVLSKYIEGGEISLDLSDQAAGIYFYKIEGSAQAGTFILQ